MIKFKVKGVGNIFYLQGREIMVSVGREGSFMGKYYNLFMFIFFYIYIL